MYEVLGDKDNYEEVNVEAVVLNATEVENNLHYISHNVVMHDLIGNNYFVQVSDEEVSQVSEVVNPIPIVDNDVCSIEGKIML